MAKNKPLPVPAPAPGPFYYAAFRETALARLRSGDTTLTGADSLLAPPLRDLMENLLVAEVQAHIAAQPA